MNTKPKSIALLGIIGLLACTNVAYGQATHAVFNDPLPNTSGQIVVAGSSLLATGNPQPATTTQPEPSTPELVVAEPLFEFGRVLEGTEVVHDFLIENRGTGDLHIDQVRTG